MCSGMGWCRSNPSTCRAPYCKKESSHRCCHVPLATGGSNSCTPDSSWCWLVQEHPTIRGASSLLHSLSLTVRPTTRQDKTREQCFPMQHPLSRVLTERRVLPLSAAVNAHESLKQTYYLQEPVVEIRCLLLDRFDPPCRSCHR